MTVTGTVASSNAPPDRPDDVDVNPARVRHEKDPVNLEQTAFVSSLVRAPPEATAPAPGPGPAGVHLDAPNGVESRVDAGGTSTETDAGDAYLSPTKPRLAPTRVHLTNETPTVTVANPGV